MLFKLNDNFLVHFSLGKENNSSDTNFVPGSLALLSEVVISLILEDKFRVRIVTTAQVPESSSGKNSPGPVTKGLWGKFA